MSHYEGRATNPNRPDRRPSHNFKYPTWGHEIYLPCLSGMNWSCGSLWGFFAELLPSLIGLRGSDPNKSEPENKRDLNKREVTNRLNSLLTGMNKPSADGYCEIKSADCNICSSDHSNTRIKRPVLIPRTRSMRTYGG
jgi:hypothetical protein